MHDIPIPPPQKKRARRWEGGGDCKEKAKGMIKGEKLKFFNFSFHGIIDKLHMI